MIRSAATLLVTRAGPAGLEVLMARRTASASFAGGLWVFPGGVVEEVDSSDLAMRLLGTAASDVEAAPFMSAALRETAEEINAFVTTAPPLAGLRATLGRLDGDDLLSAMDAAGLRFANVTYWSNWITPRSQPKRYDTRFFIVEVEPDLGFEPDGSEIVEVAWLSPTTALAGRKDTYRMMFPTIRNLVRLSHFDAPGQAIAAAAAQHVSPIEPAPVLDETGALHKLLVPGDDGYDEVLAAQVPHSARR